jgi:8-hydroxy-5-deazaflavin:NADPH oxidoreductase
MNITIIGAGNMAHGIGTRIVEGKHNLTIQDRKGEKAKELAAKLGDTVKAQELGEPITSDIVIFALPFTAITEVIEKYKDSLSGKILVDISNPINFETFELLPPADSSGAEEIAKQLPKDAKIVKAFNTTLAGTLVQGTVDGKKLDAFIASDDVNAGETIARLADEGGLRGIYIGPLKRARALEGMQLIHMALQEQLGTNWMSTLKILS